MRRLPTLLALLLASSASAGTVTGRVQVIEKGGRAAGDLSDVVVWIEGARAKPRPATVQMAMKNKQFVPRVVVVPVGGTVAFPNEDPIFHNVFSVSGDNRFDLQLYKRPKSGSFTFQSPGIARVYCNIHPQMSAVIVVRDNPFYARANADGTFTIDNVPSGKYTVKAWHERGGEASTAVTVSSDGRSGAVQLALDASAFKKAAHKNKYGRDYESSDSY